MEQNKIILFSNIKGGVGKTSLCGLFATYLAEKGMPVAVLDADLQQSLIRHRQREMDADPNANVPWQIASLDTTNAKDAQKVMDKMKQIPGWVLVDCPGNLNDPNLLPLFTSADVVIIPLSYDPDTVDATTIFISVIRKRNPAARLIFLPNRISTQEGRHEELEQRKQTIDVLGKIGSVVPRIKQSVVIKRYTTLYPLDSYQQNAVRFSFDKIIDEINRKQKI